MSKTISTTIHETTHTARRDGSEIWVRVYDRGSDFAAKIAKSLLSEDETLSAVTSNGNIYDWRAIKNKTTVGAHGFEVTVTAETVNDLGTPDEQVVPAHAQIEFQELGISLMLGRSPVDGRLVLHIDGDLSAEHLARVYLNDRLPYFLEFDQKS